MQEHRTFPANRKLLERLQTANTLKLEEAGARMTGLRGRARGLGRAATAVLPARAVARYLEMLACALFIGHSDAGGLAGEIEDWGGFLAGLQYEDGSFDTVNRRSPPDTGFVVRSLSASALLIQGSDAPGAGRTIVSMILKAGDVLLTGGVHTPNHRWIVCDALARIHELDSDPRYLARIEEWLSEGVDIDPDSQFSERSSGIYSAEIDRALVSIHQRLGREELLEPVRANLSMTLRLVEPNGEVVTTSSRRQDQDTRAQFARYYVPYRYLANTTGDSTLVAAAERIEEMQPSELEGDLAQLLDPGFPPAPKTEAGGLPTDFTTRFPSQGIVRFRRATRSATIFGGSDWPKGVASGLSSSPTFFSCRNGAAVIDSIRFAMDFFAKGYFRSAGLKETHDGYLLHQTLSVPYYQPLPPGARRRDGAYELTGAEDRFFASMSFPLRRMSNEQRLEANIAIRRVSPDSYRLRFQASGCENVPVAIEINLRAGGILSGVTGPLGETGTYLLESGMGTYECEGDRVHFGPGTADFLWGDEVLPAVPHHLAPPTDGHTVYLTGHTPFDHEIWVG